MKLNVELDVPATMRDGVTLRANVYRPDGDGPWPTIVNRTPYGKDTLGALRWPGLDPLQAARDGFMVVLQDNRGRFASDGEWDPFRFERQDGYDTVEWAARLPGSSGRVGMYGSSYCGNTQWLAALEQPPSLAAISPLLTWSDPMDGLFARGGALELGLVLPWSLGNGLDYLARAGGSEAEVIDRLNAAIDEHDRLDAAGYWELPPPAVLDRHIMPDLGSIRALIREDVREWCRVAGLHDRVAVPSFNTAGWYDIFLQGTLDNYEAMTALGREARLVVGPWGHSALEDPVGEGHFGIRSYRDDVPAHHGRSWCDLQLAWLKQQLAPEAAVELPEAPVRIFVMGRNEWRDESEWPLHRAVDEHWYLRHAGRVGPAGPDADEPSSEFTYDPADPVPTVGGQVVMTPGYPSGQFDQTAVEARQDVLAFTSEPLAEDLEVTGRVRVVLHAESSAPSTDWVARLCDVHPDGRSLNICDGIVRVGDGATASQRVEIDLWSTSNVFLAGHRLRVHVTSSSFPRWDRNLNTGDQMSPRIEAARQRVHHDSSRASWIELPVVR